MKPWLSSMRPFEPGPGLTIPRGLAPDSLRRWLVPLLGVAAVVAVTSALPPATAEARPTYFATLRSLYGIMDDVNVTSGVAAELPVVQGGVTAGRLVAAAALTDVRVGVTLTLAADDKARVFIGI